MVGKGDLGVQGSRSSPESASSSSSSAPSMTSSVSVGGDMVPLSITGVVGSVVVGRLGVSAMLVCAE